MLTLQACSNASTATLSLKVAYNAPLQEAMLRLQETSLQQIVMEGVIFSVMDECCSSIPTEGYLPSQTAYVVPTDLPIRDVSPTQVFNNILSTSNAKPSSAKIGLALGLVAASVALVSVAVVMVIGVFIKFKGRSLRSRILECQQEQSTIKRKTQKHINYYEEVEDIEEYTTKGPEHKQSVTGTDLAHDNNVAVVQGSSTEQDSIPPLPIPRVVHYYDTIGDSVFRERMPSPRPETPHLTCPSPPTQDEGSPVRVSPYRVSTILLIDEPFRTPDPRQSTSRSSSPKTPVPLENAYSKVEKSPSPYATLEPFIHSEADRTKLTCAEEEYSRLVHH